jgi:hypothetical protein
MGIILIICAMVPVFAAMIIAGDFRVLEGSNLWVTLGVAFTVGLAAAITAIGSGLNTFGTMLTFILSFATALYVLFIGVTIAPMLQIPYSGGAIIDGISLFLYAIGVFAIATTPR